MRIALWVSIVVFLFVPTAACAAGVLAISEVTALPRGALATSPEVTVCGTVIGMLPDDGEAIVEDAAGGIRVMVDAATTIESHTKGDDVAAGDQIEVVGRAERTGFAPSIRATHIVKLGRRPLPAPRRCDVEDFFAGGEDCRLVELEGVVQQVWQEAGRLRLEIGTQSRLFIAEIPLEVAERFQPGIGQDPQSLVDSMVRVAGPAMSVCNVRGEILRPWLRVDRAEWFSVLSADVATIGSVVPIDEIGRLWTGAGRSHRVATFGTVVHAIPGRTVYLQNGHRGVTVSLGAGAAGTGERFVAGDHVEVAGFIDRSGHVAAIRSAEVTKIGHHGSPPPLMAMPAAILGANTAAAELGAQADPGDYQGCLVQCSGYLVQSQPVTDGGVLVVRFDGVIFTAEADAATFPTLSGIEPGSFLTLTGVAAIDGDDLSRGRDATGVTKRLRLMLRGTEDVRVVRGPPWWTAARLAAFLGATGTVLTAALAWGMGLRRQLAAQKSLLASEMRSRRDAAVEYEATLRERTRLAANLHDTLQQTIGGIGYQLDACLAGESGIGLDTRQHVDVARRMVRYAESEIQGAVWAMRSLSLGGKPLAEALRDLMARVGDGHEARMTVEVVGNCDDLPEFVAGNLLLICQEAAHNALRHGKPAAIQVSLTDDRDHGTVHLRVADDGRGFVVGRQSGASAGHFGVQGMQERAERLGGKLTMTSQPGRGTVVEATVQRRDYDTHIEGEGEAPRP